MVTSCSWTSQCLSLPFEPKYPGTFVLMLSCPSPNHTNLSVPLRGHIEGLAKIKVSDAIALTRCREPNILSWKEIQLSGVICCLVNQCCLFHPVNRCVWEMSSRRIYHRLPEILRLGWFTYSCAQVTSGEVLYWKRVQHLPFSGYQESGTFLNCQNLWKIVDDNLAMVLARFLSNFACVWCDQLYLCISNWPNLIFW